MYKDSDTKCSSCSKEYNNGYINVNRFINKLDDYFKTNDLDGAKSHLLFWENEAKVNNDIKALVTILNEELGFSRRIDDKELGLKAVNLLKEIFNNKYFLTPSYATVLTNMATTISAFGNSKESISMYEQAKDVYKEYNLLSSYEYAALLNNESTAYSNLKEYELAKKDINEAIDILKIEGKHDAEIAVSLINLAHATYDNDSSSQNEVERILDQAWEYINSRRQPHDQNYAFVLSKCAPSLRYFKRELEADAIEEIAKEIYGSDNL